jgi:hypothetical protein
MPRCWGSMLRASAGVIEKNGASNAETLPLRKWPKRALVFHHHHAKRSAYHYYYFKTRMTHTAPLRSASGCQKESTLYLSGGTSQRADRPASRDSKKLSAESPSPGSLASRPMMAMGSSIFILGPGICPGKTEETRKEKSKTTSMQASKNVSTIPNKHHISNIGEEKRDYDLVWAWISYTCLLVLPFLAVVSPRWCSHDAKARAYGNGPRSKHWSSDMQLAAPSVGDSS